MQGLINLILQESVRQPIITRILPVPADPRSQFVLVSKANSSFQFLYPPSVCPLC